MPFDSYSNLKAAIIDELDRSDLTDKVDDLIDLAEGWHRDGEDNLEIPPVRIREMLTRTQLTVNSRFLSLPADFLEMMTLRLLTDPVTVLTEVNLHEMNRRRRETTGTPKFFTIHADIEFDVAVAAASPLTAEMIYYAELTPLSDANTSNALLTRSPGCYFYGALKASAPWLSEDERLATWERLYRSTVTGLVPSDRRARHAGPLVAAVAGATP